MSRHRQPYTGGVYIEIDVPLGKNVTSGCRNDKKTAEQCVYPQSLQSAPNLML